MAGRTYELTCVHCPYHARVQGEENIGAAAQDHFMGFTLNNPLGQEHRDHRIKVRSEDSRLAYTITYDSTPLPKAWAQSLWEATCMTCGFQTGEHSTEDAADSAGLKHLREYTVTGFIVGPPKGEHALTGSPFGMYRNADHVVEVRAFKRLKVIQ